MPLLRKRRPQSTSKAGGRAERDADDGVAQGLKATLRVNLKDMMENSHEPLDLLARLEQNINQGGFLAFHLLSHGWKDALQSMRDGCVNGGVTTALIASMTVPLALDWPALERWGIDRQEGDDHWSDSRDTIRQYFMVFMATAAWLSMATVIVSCIWCEYSHVFVQDAEDAMWFCTNFPFLIVDWMLFLTTLSVGAGMFCGYIAVNTGMATDIIFIIGCVICGLIFFGWVLALANAQFHRRRSLTRLNSTLLQIVFEAKQLQLNAPAGGAAVLGS